MNRRRAERKQEDAQDKTYARLELDRIYIADVGRQKIQESSLVALAASIARHGLLQPIVVRKNACFERYAIVCGRRRLAACRMLGLKRIDAVIIEATEGEAAACFLEEHMTHEPTCFADEAHLIRDVGYEQVREAFALPQTQIDRRMALLSLVPETIQMLADHGAMLEQAEPLLAVNRRETQMEMASVILQRGLTPQQARRLVDAPSRGEPSAEGKGTLRRTLNMIEDAVKKAKRCGMQVDVSMHSRREGMCIQLLIRNEGTKRLHDEEKERICTNDG